MRPRSVSVEETGADLFVAVENASHRLKRSVARALEREKAWSDGHPAPHTSPTAAKLSVTVPGRKVVRRGARRVLPHQPA